MVTDFSLTSEQIQTLFNSIKIESKVMSIENLFSNLRRRSKTKVDPYYQRNYVWDNDKATYFIESILLGTEIPPLIFFNNGSVIEVIDGRQRFETIDRFLNNDFNLTNKGLNALKSLKKNHFNNLDQQIKEIFFDTKLRVIEYNIINDNVLDEPKEDFIKKEIFRRYNSGITALKKSEIDKAIYINNDLNSHIKMELKNNKSLYNSVIDLFFLERDQNILEKVLLKIRLLLVLHKIPIKYYSTLKGREAIVQRLFENLSNRISDAQEEYVIFKNKIQILKEIKEFFVINNKPHNRLVFECLFWSMSIIENEKRFEIKKFKSVEFKTKLANYIEDNFDKYSLENSHFYKEFNERYSTTALFIGPEFGIKLDIYLNNYSTFKKEINELVKDDNKNNEKMYELESLRLNKPDASTNTIEDILRQLMRGKFLVRPPYQRGEAINKVKSSAIIESILLGMQLPPLFIYKREDGVSEVVDGQQRLLSILGYIGRSFSDENGDLLKSDKNEYKLSKLKILENLEGKKYEELSEKFQNKILDFNISLVNIDAKINPNFDPIDLFIRLNNKPYPIRENTFEMWNSYIDKDIISTTKENTKKWSNWFSVRMNNKRMENEELYISLAYLEFKSAISSNDMSGFLDIYQRGDKINCRIKSKTDISKILDSASQNTNIKSQFLFSIKQVESFIKKVKALLIDKDIKDDESLKSELNKLFSLQGNSSRRTLQSFYLLWYLLKDIGFQIVLQNRANIKKEIQFIFEYVKHVEDLTKREEAMDGFEKLVEQLRNFYVTDERKITLSKIEKQFLIKEQQGVCPLCNSFIYDGDDIEVDHSIPISIGGKDKLLNLKITHKFCNRKKGSKLSN